MTDQPLELKTREARSARVTSHMKYILGISAVTGAIVVLTVYGLFAA